MRHESPDEHYSPAKKVLILSFHVGGDMQFDLSARGMKFIHIVSYDLLSDAANLDTTSHGS